MMNAVTYITRKCPRACKYCAIRDDSRVGTELSMQDWGRAFQILKEMGVTFNLILGNEPWVLGSSLGTIMKKHTFPYAIYTTCPEPMFSKYKDIFFGQGLIDNLSCGLDWPRTYVKDRLLLDDSERKAYDAWKAFEWVKQKYPNVDTHGNITMHRMNAKYVPQIVRDLAELEIFTAINIIHWDTDGGFDFFPRAYDMKEFLFKPGDLGMLRDILAEVRETPAFLHNYEMLKSDPYDMIDTRFHCDGDPYGGPTVDADGTLRVCGYRRGTRTPKLTIFDLPERIDDWREAVYLDSKDCPGCFWVCPWVYKYWINRDPNMGQKVFTRHAGEHIAEEHWADRERS